MHRIESSNYIRDSAGHNLFTDGPPGTTANDAWLNALQEEVCNVIEYNGGSVLTKNSDTRTQLRDKILKLLEDLRLSILPERFNVINSNSELETNKQYIITNPGVEVTFPIAVIGDTIRIFFSELGKIAQDEAEEVITYLNSFFTTKGISGYFVGLVNTFIELTYRGDKGYAKIPGTKLSNPSSLPAGQGNCCAFSLDSIYLAVGHSNNPFITIYKRSGDVFAKLANPADLPPSEVLNASFSSNGDYLACISAAANYLTIYKRSGDTFTKLADPVSLPAGSGNGISFSEDSNYLVVSHANNPFITIYKRSGDVFTKLADPSDLPANTAYGVAWSYDSQYLAVSYQTSSPYIIVYKRSGDTFTKLSDPSDVPTGHAVSCTFSSDGKYLVMAGSTAPHITIYKLFNDVLTKITPVDFSSHSTSTSVVFSFDCRHMFIACFGGNKMATYEINGNTFTALSDPVTHPASFPYGVAVSRNNNYLAYSHAGSPYVTIYKNISSSQKTWEVTRLSLESPVDKDYIFK